MPAMKGVDKSELELEPKQTAYRLLVTASADYLQATIGNKWQDKVRSPPNADKLTPWPQTDNRVNAYSQADSEMAITSV